MVVRFRPTLVEPDSWARVILNWQQRRDSVLDLSGLGSADEPVPDGLLSLLPGVNDRIGHLDCRGAHLAAPSFAGARFFGEALFSGATVTGSADFRRSWFGGVVDFSSVTFSGTARFSESRFWASVDFTDATFAAPADFSRAIFYRDSVFEGVAFDGEASFARTRCKSELILSHSRLDGDLSFVEIDAPRGIVLDGSVVPAGRHELSLVAGAETRVDVSAALRVEGELVVRLGRRVDFDAERLTVRGPMTVVAAQSSGLGGRVLSLEQADVTAPLRLGRRIDLSRTIWGDQDLTHVSLADTSSLPRKRPLAEWRRLLGRPVEGRRGRRVIYGDLRSSQPDSVLERNYRDLRRQLESGGNVHGGGDFYYGEMAARRRQAPWFSAGYWILTVYWLVSGYGTRAWTAVASWFLLTIAGTRLLLIGGVSLRDPDEELAGMEVWRFVLEASLSFFRPTNAPLLSVPETLIILVVRILGPVLFGMAGLAVRNQVKR